MDVTASGQTGSARLDQSMPKSTVLLYSNDGTPYDMENKAGSVCWWDTEPFTGICYPAARRRIGNRKIWEVSGVYCSPNCAKAAMLHDNKNHWIKLDIFNSMLKEVYKIKTEKIPVAFPRSQLKKFNPTHGMDIKEFRRDCVKYNLEVVSSPMVILAHNVWKTSNGTDKPRAVFGYQSMDFFKKKSTK